MELWIGAIILGFLYAFMTMGVFVTFRVYNFPDITVDGSFTSGAAVAATLIVAGIHPALALLAALFAGALAGAATALIHTRFNINGLLSGILVMTGLYSINLHLMGRSNVPLLQNVTLLTWLERINPGLPGALWTALALIPIMVLFWWLVAIFFKTDLGMAMRATGDNATMAAANGINVDRLRILGLALANGLVGVSGGLIAQYQGFADVTMGVGTIVVGLASVIIGESALRIQSIYGQILSVIVGSIVFRLMIALALYLGLNPIDLKILTAGFVLLTLIASKTFSGRPLDRLKQKLSVRRSWGYVLAAAILVAGLGWWFSNKQNPVSPESVQTKPAIGVLVLSDSQLLHITKDSFLEEMKAKGYIDGRNCRFYVENAHGDMPTVNMILDKFLQDRVNLVLTISTGATQAALKKVRDRPLVFASVANPFIIDAGRSDSDHLPNVTGVYGWVPLEKTMAIVRRIFPGPLRIGAIWDPSQANSVFNVGILKKALEAYPDMTFLGATVAGTSEVYQSVLSLVSQKVDVLVLPTDNIIYSAFDAVVAAARTKQVPIVMGDVERLADGAMMALGYDYTSSGQQAAGLVHRILQGENPRDIPFEQYRRLTIGFNLDVARQLGVQIPPDVLAQANVVLPRLPSAGPTAQARKSTADTKNKRLAVFLFNDNKLVMESYKGVQDELQASGLLIPGGLSVDFKSAQGDFPMAQAIAQDLVRQKFDYIITLSTPALQLTAQFNKVIPHVFGTVTDPYRVGAARSPRDHQSNLTGVATFQPLDMTLKLTRQVFPKAKKIGLVWNPSEPSSEACTLKTRSLAPRYHFELVETTVTSTAEVQEAVQSVLSKNIDLFFTSGDNTVLLAVDTITQILKTHRIPYITNNISDVDRGAFMGVGPDYYDVGRETARMALEVIRGADPKDLPIRDYAPEIVYINTVLANDYGVILPEEILKKAANVKRN